MGLQLIIDADSPAQLAPMWRALGGATATVEIIDDVMGVQVDLRQPLDLSEALCDYGIRTATDDQGQEIKWFRCQLLKEHDGPHFYHEVGAYNDELELVSFAAAIEADDDDPYGELTPEQEAQVEEVLSHPIHPEGLWEDAQEAPGPDHDGHTVEVGEVEEVTDDLGPEPSTGEPTLRDEIAAVLNRHPDRTFTVAEVYEHVDGSTTGSVGATLKWLVNNGRVRCVARGHYQALDRSAVHDARRQAAAAAMYSS